MQVIQVQFEVNKRPYQVVGVADSADAVVAALRTALASSGFAPDDNFLPAEVLWDSADSFTYDQTAPLVTAAAHGADAGWLVSIITEDQPAAPSGA